MAEKRVKKQKIDKSIDETQSDSLSSAAWASISRVFSPNPENTVKQQAPEPTKQQKKKSISVETKKSAKVKKTTAKNQTTKNIKETVIETQENKNITSKKSTPKSQVKATKIPESSATTYMMVSSYGTATFGPETWVFDNTQLTKEFEPGRIKRVVDKLSNIETIFEYDVNGQFVTTDVYEQGILKSRTKCFLFGKPVMGWEFDPTGRIVQEYNYDELGQVAEKKPQVNNLK